MMLLNLLFSTLCDYREDHLQKKIDQIVKEAKVKMSKGDKKGKSTKRSSDLFFESNAFAYAFFSFLAPSIGPFFAALIIP